MSDKKTGEGTPFAKEDSRTSEFYNYLRSTGSSEDEIRKFRERLQKSPMTDTLTDYFIHEANNALWTLVDRDENGKPTIDSSAQDFADGRTRFLNVKRGINWFKKDGSLPKDKITSFLSEVEGMGDWNQDLAIKIFSKFKDLTKKK